MDKILFYYENESNGHFSNFYPCNMELKGKVWSSVEHYYQAQKAAGNEYEETIRLAPNPDEAKKLGNAPECPLRSNWNDFKIEAMKTALRAKYTQNADLRSKLVESGDALLIENSQKDYFWGIGADGTGLSMLGKLLMELRDDLNEG